ncbi:MAG: FimV/HubP family polar landmark protein [Pseudomonadota bacterium]
MPRRFVRFSLAFTLLLSSQAFALGLGEIRIDSALNEPLRAEIELLSASPEEVADLKITLASEATFSRYGLDRPFFLSEIQFQIFRTGRADGNVIRVSSPSPITEPFITFLIEATWPSGRLLREYTLLLDPPTFAPPAASQPAPAVVAPQRSQTSDSAQIERQPIPRATPQPEPARPPVRSAPVSPAPADPAPATPAPATPAPAPEPERAVDDAPFATTPGGDHVVQRGETLWGLAARMRPDSRLTMNQTMLAIFEANPAAFGGNINILRAGASLRMPSADEIIRIDRGDAFREAQRQHAEWDSGYTPAPTVPETPEPEQPSQPSLQLVPPDEDLTAIDSGTDSVADAEPLTREQQVLDRIAEIEAEGVPVQQSLIEIRDNELASLREELARIRGEVYEPPVDALPEDDIFVDEGTGEDEPATDGELVPDFSETTDDTAVEDAVEEPVVPVRAPEPSLVDRIIGWATSVYAVIGLAVLLALGILTWFIRRNRGDDDPDSWQPLDSDDLGAMSAGGGTESIRAPDRDEAFVVVEQEPAISATDDTVETPTPAVAATADGGDDETGQFGSLEDTFSSETAINLDQSDPIAEADFHMAYGLYDQAADLINGAIESDPGRQDLLSKLCEIYFVWGNRDAFVEAATRLKAVVGGVESAEWDKIVIMGQQIAADDALFAGAGTAAATREMDLSFDSDESGGTGSLDMEFGDEAGADDVIDLGATSQTVETSDDGVDFLFDDADGGSDDSNLLDLDLESTAESPTLESSMTGEPTREMPALDDATGETQALGEAFADADETSQLPSIEDTDTVRSVDSTATAEIDLADLGLDVDGLAETEVASLDDLDATGTNELLSDTDINPALEERADVTGKNLEVDPNATGVQTALREADETGLGDAADFDRAMGQTGTMRLAADETGVNAEMAPVLPELGEDLLAATGKTQVLPDDFVVQTGGQDAELGDGDATMLAPGLGGAALGDDDATLLAGLEDDADGDFDFAKTEALPPDVFTGDGDNAVEQTGELPVASTDVDLDLDDLTAALKVSAGGDTVDMPRDDATVEQPRPSLDDGESPTMSLEPGDIHDDLEDARTMTEVGTKLDLARAYVDMGDPGGARSILEEVLDEGDEGQRQQAQSLLDSLPA